MFPKLIIGHILQSSWVRKHYVECVLISISRDVRPICLVDRCHCIDHWSSSGRAIIFLMAYFFINQWVDISVDVACETLLVDEPT